MNFKPLFFTIIPGILLGIPSSIQAQVIEDSSLSTEVQTENNRDFNINGGEQTGNNLFHSFAEFSIPTNGSAFFNNALTVENIITRVTGSSISNIDGLIGSNGTANLFLLNPNGIIFGENASLNIGGSFIGTTAESLVFEDGIEFSTKLDNSETLLTVTVPLGLQFGSNPGNITNRANFSIPSRFDPTGEERIKLGLTTLPGKTLGLLGGDITFDGGAIAAPGGNIELGSVAENSFVPLESIAQGWTANYDNVSQFRDIKLNNVASVDGSGEGAGDINILGRNIQLFNGSAITSNTLGALDGGAITIRGSDLVEINGSDLTGTKLDSLLAGLDIFFPFASQISSNTIGTGKGGNVEIIAQNLKLVDGSSISLQTLALSPEQKNLGQSGNLNIQVSDSIQLAGNRPLLGIGENAENLVLPSIGLDTAIEINLASGIQVLSISDADGGDLKIITQNISLRDGATIATAPFLDGNAGNVEITASESIEIMGTTSKTGEIGSNIASNTVAIGDAGNINLNTDRLTIKNGGLIISSSNSVGNAGNIDIEAASIEISGFSPFNDRVPSLISAETDDGGNGGNIFIRTDSLSISDRAILSVRGSGTGIPGNLRVNANTIDLSNFASITAGTEFQSGGNIELNVKDSLTLRENSLISARAFGDANGGNLDIEVKFLIANPNENNDILATAVRGNGGNINIGGDGIFGVLEGLSQPPNSSNDIDASSEFGVDGTVNFDFPNFNESDFATNKSYEAIDENNLIGNNFCNLSVGSEYYFVGKGGIAVSPDRDLIVEDSWTDLRFFDDDQLASRQAIESIEATEKVKKVEMIRGWVKDRQGKIVLTTNPVAIAPLSPELPRPDCNTKRVIGNE
ncbi:filamentous hemagglutinin N-terminal domain-containing protein [Waterburya agarophytonicola K14]|uniref:Filamentous hemagglutinin N-terminal domain-containing protein n=1 Tax=Waterburya agarophytonicola KI4 TaxID=2874699 RepID=A0A964BP69_9CYAN|nr:filamentous hemagglutinin N-terminal domain-containing protein [Waterburya agarophytonicola]MCC0175621.1 filamentous hemagglutinin N-terminal domain-containing protein [Waterburya agarophytonicola KI4]